MIKVYLVAFLIVLLDTAGCNCGSSSNDSTEASKIPGQPAVNAFSATALSSSEILLKWDNTYVGGIQGNFFSIERKSSTEVDFKTIVANFPHPLTVNIQYKDTGLLANTNYTYKLYANLNNGKKSLPTETNGTTLVAAAKLPNVTIGSQIWASTNLEVTTYRNGDPIPQVTSWDQWKTTRTGAWCYLNFDTSNGSKFGKLYNRFAIDDSRGIAPNGWRIPTSQDWYTLMSSQGGKNVAGDKLKSTQYWLASGSTSVVPTNSSGFNGLPGGFVSPSVKTVNAGQEGKFWTSSDSTYSMGTGRINFFLYYGTSELYPSVDTTATMGYSIRCIKN